MPKKDVKPHSLCIHFLNVGDGDNIIVEFPKPPGAGGERLYGIVDCYVAKKTIDYLNKLGAKKLEFICATHPHSDHIKGIPALLRKYKGKINQFWDCGFRHKSDTHLEIIDLISKDKKIKFMRVTSGFEETYNDVKITVLAPSIYLRNRYETYGVNVNNASIVLKFDYTRIKGKKGSVVILAGDAQFDSWGKICEEFPYYIKTKDPKQLIKYKETYNPLNCQVLKVSHHGSKHGTALELIERVDPEYAVLSCTKNRWFHQLTKLALLDKIKPSRIYYTYDKGSKVAICNGSGRPKIKSCEDSIKGSPKPPQ